jgi:Tfp pilus assembly protein PilF
VQSAATLLKKTINADPDSILAYRELSHIFEKKGNVDKALYYIKKELESLTHRIKE